jgi:hypothetical protein
MSLTSVTGDNFISGVISATTTTGAISLTNGSGSFLVCGHATAVAGAGTLAVKVQDSDDGVTFADMTNIVLPTLNAANQTVAPVFGHSAKRFIRLVGTLTGTSVTCNVSVLGFGVV